MSSLNRADRGHPAATKSQKLDLISWKLLMYSIQSFEVSDGEQSIA